ncbi:DUF3500 domain-containing protein [Sabulilitoribacter arenilitoris]|uniref:DUF3500 domain-containing protein n=1 Tax=Wocania arenilitoris TaxID=2044858 RepID=A0AAE3ESZ3_9FLAO|nr:DUF3500 domain-containing protein [Wocania arenilitoris]MCF7569565.1 DUF3500 domain-containing protein [Wocania arenilitoris]
MKSFKVLVILFLISFSNAQSNEVLAFINSLNENQLKKTALSFDDLSRETWHFLPATMYKRHGIALYDLDETQKTYAFNLLKHHLSNVGYLKAKKIIELERYLGELSGDKVFRDPEKYYIAIYGNPKIDTLWSWSFEGHHISLNFTISNEKISASPRFMGTNPAEIKEGTQKGERVLQKEEDLAFELMNSMDEEQKSKAIFNSIAFPDILTFNKSKVEPLENEGIKAKNLNEEQKAILTELIKEYLLTIPKELAKERYRAIRISEFDDIQFAWAGSTNKSKGYYYRIQGDTFLIEFDNTQNNANHVHTVWRDFNDDFGRNLIKEHYQNASHHKKH